MKKSLIVLSIITVLLYSFSAYAASIVVNSDGDDTTGGNAFCTLREAINNANSDSDTTGGDCTGGSGTDTITFSSDFDITLSSTLPQITTNIIIDGTGHAVAVDGNNSNRCFDVSGATSGDLTVNLLTIINGNGGPTGGGINNTGTLTVTDSTISNSVAGSGGGIYNTGTLTVSNSTISGNSTTTSNNGGGIYNTGTITSVTNSTISGNTAANSDGGGIYNTGIISSITNSTISDNTAGGEFGGGIYNTGTITSITKSTFSGNSATFGAGIYNDTGADNSIANSTFSGNSAATFGGGIHNNTGADISIANSTFSGNSAISGAGIYSNGTITTLANTIIAFNTGGNCFGTAPSNSKSNLADSTGCATWGAQATLLPEHLGPLASNGGPTQTMALLLSAPANPAIDTGDATTCSSPPVNGLDQRSVTRPQGPDCDIGAFEQEAFGYLPGAVYLPLLLDD